MKKRIVSLVCAIAVLVTMLTIGISAVSAVEPVVNVSQAAFNATDWTGDTANIDQSNRFYATSKDKKTIWTASSYNLTGGFTFSSRCYINANVNNFYGEYAALYVGEPGTGVELRIQNVTGQKNWNAHLVVAGNEVATANVMGSPNTNAPNGGWELSYADGKLTVNHIQSVGSTPKAVTWTLATSGTATQIDISSVDLTNVKFGVHIEGNYSSADKRMWAAYWIKVMPAASSSVPESSVPASSEPVSSTVPTVGEKLTSAISGVLVAEDWDPSDNIVDGKISTAKNDKVIAVSSVKTFDLGTDWESYMSFVTPTSMGNLWSQPITLKIGEVEAIVYNSDGTNGARIALNVKGAEVAEYKLGAGVSTNTGEGYSGKIVLKYKDGAITVNYKDENVIVYDASGAELDFSAINAGLSAKGNWAEAPKNFKITEFGLTSADVLPEPGAPIETIKDGVFNDTDWTGDVGNINTVGNFKGNFYATGTTKKTIWTAKAYDLSGGFKYSSRLYFKNGYNNYYGEHAAIYIGDIDVGLELRIQNNKGSGMYTGYLYLGGKEIATADLYNAPNGGWEIVYQNGKVTVNQDENPTTWTLADSTKTTTVDISSADFSKAKIGMHIEGNYTEADRRLWNTYNLSALSGSGSPVQGTGDTRNIVIPAIVLVMSACAVAFIAIRRKSNA